MSTKRAPQAIRLYALRLSGPSSTSGLERWAIHYMTPAGELAPLWGFHIDSDPGDSRAWDRAGRKAAAKWPHMTYAPRPAPRIRSGPFPGFPFPPAGLGIREAA